MDSPYRKFSGQQLILRDHLAIDRTILANERTFLAYVRTALTQFIAGVTFVRFFDSRVMLVVGWIFIPLGFATLAFGYLRYRRTKRNILLAGAA
jgi:putative membrane protein